MVVPVRVVALGAGIPVHIWIRPSHPWIRLCARASRVPMPEPAAIASTSGPSSPHLTSRRLLDLAGTCSARALLPRGWALMCGIGPERGRWRLDLKRKKSSSTVAWPRGAKETRRVKEGLRETARWWMCREREERLAAREADY
ncbi:hypothetical protein PAHAL_5G453000 [Panicum hallii]|uniref:Uncharacterized protein n=2 Tax=Panicum hallii TaxID=206008 RepID=A0A2T8INF8_9POAL|nr:hypothetical protein PAHAL_5G453000 [Panicum hallii]PVH39197.1 hypothetical protein PAHAL_5G453000 [Panicum hallii]PVH39198.1 hypothetical protein PAHAL_5G453000 [Panicum hallii]